MLDRMRAFASTWPARILIVALMVGLAFWGISNVFVNLGSTTVATVGGQEISTRQFERALRAQLNAYADRVGALPSLDQAIAQGIPSSVLQQLAATAAMEGLATDFGMGASDARIADQVAKDPGFLNVMGGFDRQRFNEVLRQNGWTEAEYLGAQAGVVQRQQLVEALFRGLPAPATMQDIVRRYQSDTRTLEYFTLSFTNVGPIPDPTDGELQNHLEANQSRYRTAESRTVRVLALTPETYAASLEITDTDLLAEYERTAAQFVAPARRTVSTLDLPAGVEAQFAVGASGGMDFQALVNQTGLADAVRSLGTLTRAEMTDAALAEAAFGLQAGEFAVIDGAGGKRAVYVSAADPGGQLPFEAAKDQLREKLALQKARDAMPDMIDQIEEMRAALVSIDDIAGQFGLSATPSVVTRDGGGLDAVPGLPEDARGRVAQSVFQATEGRLAAAIPLSADSTVWFDLVSVQAARDQTLAEARDAVVRDWTAERTDELLAARAAELADRLDQGEAIDVVASQVGAFPQVSTPIGRAGDGTFIGQNVAQAAFEGGVGYAGSARNAEGEYVVFQVDDIQAADTTGTDQEVASTLADVLSQSAYTQFIAAIETDAGLGVNQQALQDVMNGVLGAP